MKKQDQIRILHALGTMNPGGVETWLLHIMRYVDPDRIRFHFCTFGPEPGLYAPEIEKLGGRILRCPKGENPFSLGRRFRQILRTGEYDAVHSHVTLFSGAVLRWAKAEGVSIRIAHSHTSRDDRPDTLARRSYRKLMRSWINWYATHGLAASRLAAANLFGEHWQADPRVRVLYYGIDLEPFRQSINKEEVRKELGLPLESLVVGHVGRFVQPKNHAFILEIAAEILQQRPDIHFLLVGDGPLRPEIEARAKVLGLAEKIHFAGTRTDVPRILRGAMDVFILPSLWEGLPVAVIEAQAAGLHCILSEAVTNEASIIPEQLIWLSASKTPQDWAARTIDALGRAKVSSELVLGSIAKTKFCVRQSISQLSDVYGAVKEQQERADSISIS